MSTRDIDNVEFMRRIFQQSVDNDRELCYNMRMKREQIRITGYFDLINENCKDKFMRFRELLISYNQRYNLTAITEEKEITYKHFLDSLAGESLFSKGANVAEIGSGAGFPSIPLKIYREDLQFTLFESTGKKCEFLKTVIKELGLEGVAVENMRAEDGAKGKYREQFDVSCARAVARMNTLTEYCLPFVRVGGKMIAYKGNEEEVEEARNAVRILGGAIEECYFYELPENYGSRVLAVVNKIKETPAKYPRGNGKERRKPIL